MEIKYRVGVSFVILVLLVFGLYFFTDWFSKVTGYFSGEAEKEGVMNCLKDSGSEYYSGTYCAECENQEIMIGRAISAVNKITCETDKNGEIADERCKNLKSVPAWYVNKEIYYGVKDISELKNISGC